MYARYAIPAALLCGLLLGCTAQSYQIDKHVLASSSLLDPNDLAIAGICIMPMWNTHANAFIEKPPVRSLEKSAGQRGFRTVRIVKWKNIAKSMKRHNREEQLKTFVREGFGTSKVNEPDTFWKDLGCGYFLQISVEQGDILKLFDRRQRIEITLHGALFQVAARSVVWQGQSACHASLRNASEQEELLKQGAEAILDLLPLDFRGPLPKEDNW